jgi:very-short-patch-repair endonuclease
LRTIEIAKEDGIKIARTGEYLEYLVYHPKCSKCGNECTVSKYERGKLYVCKKCTKEEKCKFQKEKQERTFKRAISCMKRNIYMRHCIKDYKNAIQIVEQMIFNGTKFDSKEEVIVAVQLTKDNIKFENQKEIAGHKVDFCLTDLKVIIEVDGKIYHTNKKRDKIIDDNVKSVLGLDWEIIRISDDNVNFYIAPLAKIINEVLCERKHYTEIYGTHESSIYNDELIDDIMFDIYYSRTNIT